MANGILPVTGIPNPIAPVTPIGAAGPASGASFGSILSDAVGQVNQLSSDASASVQRFLSGESEELHKTLIATQQAELSLELFMQVRNKAVQAYQEIMRMQL